MSYRIRRISNSKEYFNSDEGWSNLRGTVYRDDAPQKLPLPPDGEWELMPYQVVQSNKPTEEGAA